MIGKLLDVGRSRKIMTTRGPIHYLEGHYIINIWLFPFGSSPNERNTSPIS